MFPIFKARWINRRDPSDWITFHNRMFRTRDEADEFYATRIEEFKKALIKRGHHPSNYRFEYEFLYEETWCLEWFCHSTFRDRFDNPGAVLADFEEYVSRVERAQARCGDNPTPEIIQAYENQTGRKWICLMGAEDRFRWRGEDYDDPAPCACSGCVDCGVWRVNH